MGFGLFCRNSVRRIRMPSSLSLVDTHLLDEEPFSGTTTTLIDIRVLVDAASPSRTPRGARPRGAFCATRRCGPGLTESKQARQMARIHPLDSGERPLRGK